MLESFLREKSTYFTMKLHYGGILFVKIQNFVYEHSKIEYLDYVNLKWFNRFQLGNALKMLGCYQKNEVSLL